MQQTATQNHSNMKIYPSLLAADFSKLGEEVRSVAEGGADGLHLDVMDGVFVPNISFGADIISAVRGVSGFFFDVHLMITDPIRYLERFAKAGADGITIHYESCDNQTEVLKEIRSLGLRSAVALKPSTPAFVLEPLLPYADTVLVMTVEPGFGGQKYIPETVKSVEALSRMIREDGYSTEIEVDGGINPETIVHPARAGATMFVVGSSVFRQNDRMAAISGLRRAAEEAVCV